jgi:hypothetical protein
MVVALVVVVVGYRFSHPNLTETQLFLDVWPSAVLIVALVLLLGLTKSSSS